MEETKALNEHQRLLTEWVNAYTDLLFSRAFHRVSDRALAEDLVQETFLAAFKGIGEFRSGSKPETWLFSILNHKIADHFRKAYRQGEKESFSLDRYFEKNGHWSLPGAPQAWPENESNLLDDPAFHSALDQCREKLPQHWNFAVRMKYLDEKSPEEICRELEISASNYWQIIHRAKLQLRKCLETSWFKR